MPNVPQCPGCGHNFYHGHSAPPNENGLCQWCVDEQKAEFIKCRICNENATGFNQRGWLCDREKCQKIDELERQIEFIKKYE